MRRCLTLFIPFLFFTLSIGISSCKDKWERKLSEEKLETLFAELYTTEAILDKSIAYSDDTMRLAYRMDLFSKYKISDTEFDSIVAYYSHYKANRLAVILDKASEKVLQEQERYKNLAMLSSDDNDNLKEKLISPDQLPTIIPEKTYPSTRVLHPSGTVEYYSAIFMGKIPKGSTIKATVKLKGLRSLDPSQDATLKMLIGLDNGGTLPQEKEISIESSGEYSLSLTTVEELFNAKFSLILYVPKLFPAVQLYIDTLSIAYTEKESEKENGGEEEPSATTLESFEKEFNS